MQVPAAVSALNTPQKANPIGSTKQPYVTANPALKLTPAQQEALSVAKGPDPVVFITGRAGTGKSTLIAYFRALPNHVVCAPTGIAALNCGGVTLHSMFKIAPRFHDPNHFSPKPIPGLDRLRALVIDEISMVRADVLDYVSATLQYNRNSRAAFGGVKLILIGDCRQLPPVVTEESREAVNARYPSPWWFDARSLRDIPLRIVQLTQIHRQTENELVELLDRVRHGSIDQLTITKLNNRCYRGPVAPDNALVLTAKRRDAENFNRIRLNSIDSPSKTYEAILKGSFIDENEDNLPVPRKLDLKIGARVLVTKNHGHVVNGTLGVVTEMKEGSVQFKADGSSSAISLSPVSWEKHRYLFREGQFIPEVTGTYRQIPLAYGWAVTIHKAQGLTLDNVCVDLGTGAFAAGQTYVSLSRARTFGGLSLRRLLNERDFLGDVRVTRFYQEHRIM